nr:MAG TPA: hypothetical protein [Caudoviricetes sp.]
MLIRHVFSCCLTADTKLILKLIKLAVESVK